jgi:hypothetical protein
VHSIVELEKLVRELEKAAASGLTPDAAHDEALIRRVIATEYATPEERYTCFPHPRFGGKPACLRLRASAVR